MPSLTNITITVESSRAPFSNEDLLSGHDLHTRGPTSKQWQQLWNDQWQRQWKQAKEKVREFIFIG